MKFRYRKRRKRKSNVNSIYDIRWNLSNNGVVYSSEIDGDTLSNIILLSIKEGSHNLNEIANKVGCSNSVTLKLLFRLKRKGLVEPERKSEWNTEG